VPVSPLPGSVVLDPSPLPVSDVVGDGLPDAVSLGEPVSVGVLVGLADDVSVGVAVPDAVPDGVDDADEVGEALAEGGVGTGVARQVGVGVGVLVGYGAGFDGGAVGDVRTDVRAAPSVADGAARTEAQSAGGQLEGGVALADGEPLAATDPGVRFALADGLFAAVDEPDELPGVLPWVPSRWPGPPAGCEPPVSTVLLTWMMACLKGWTPSETLAMIATPASTITGRSQLIAAKGLDADCGAIQTVRGLAAGIASPAGRRRSRGQVQSTCHAQCPRHVQLRTQLTAAAKTLSSQGWGLRSPILLWIRSSPSAPGSTWFTASARAFRSALSRSSSGVVIASPPASPPDHGVSCVRIDLSAAIARAVWLFTAPLLMPIAAAMSASEKSA
jgi:hypothetical protein